MKYFLSSAVNTLPNLNWELVMCEDGWMQATVFSDTTEIERFGPLPTVSMVLYAMEKSGYMVRPDDMPSGWRKELQFSMTTKEVTRLFGLKGNQVTSACRNGSLKASIDSSGDYSIGQTDAVDWFLGRHCKKTSKKKKTGKECPLCGCQMVKDGVGKAPLLCQHCGYPRRGKCGYIIEML